VPPLLLGVIQKTKAWFAGRRGPPLLQGYFDVLRLLRKGAVYSRTTTWLFWTAPAVTVAGTLVAGLLLPLASRYTPLGFEGDVFAFACLLGLGRFFTMLAALDTGSSFEGMGASREAAFSALVEPALFLALALVCFSSGSTSLGPAFGELPRISGGAAHAEIISAAVALFVVLLAENSRMPVDDPTTHLELTMIHEVMVLDHSGPDFAFVLWGSALKLFLCSSLLVRVFVPVPAHAGALDLLLLTGGVLAVAAAVGVVESVMARLRMRRVPQFLLGAALVAALGLMVLVHRGHP
jgi:formate hydrogenlyase subunit 4